MLWLASHGVARLSEGIKAWKGSDTSVSDDRATTDPLADLRLRIRHLALGCVGSFFLLAVATAAAVALESAGAADSVVGTIGLIAFVAFLCGVLLLYFTGMNLVGLSRGRRALRNGDPISMNEDELILLDRGLRQSTADVAQKSGEGDLVALKSFSTGLCPDIVEETEIVLREGLDVATLRADATLSYFRFSPVACEQDLAVTRRRGIATSANGMWISAPVLVTVDLTPLGADRTSARIRAVSKYQRARAKAMYQAVLLALAVAAEEQDQSH